FRTAEQEKLSASRTINLTEDGLALHVHAIMIGIEGVYIKDSPNYNRLLIGGAESFENVKRALQITRLETLITGIGTDASLAEVKALAQSLLDDMQGRNTDQKDEMLNVKIDAASIKIAVTNATEGLWVVYFMLGIIYVANMA